MDIKDNDDSKSDYGNLDWKNLGFFSSEDYLIYIFKKTEKIVSALYLISGLLKDNEPIKWELRDKGIDLLSSSFVASSSLPSDKSSTIQSLFSLALETISLLNIAKLSNLISEMNHRLLIREIDQILTMLRDRLAQNAENAGYILSESFFKTPDLFSSGFRGNLNSESRSTKNDYKGQDKFQPKTLSTEGQLKGQAKNISSKSERQELILRTLRTRQNLTVKDFAGVITGCSEKTIQRELLDLVQKGLIRKEGERRWSRYWLNS